MLASVLKTEKAVKVSINIIDGKIYHFGASLKDLEKKWFGFSKFEKDALELLRMIS